MTSRRTILRNFKNCSAIEVVTVREDPGDEVLDMCEHDFRLNADGQVACVKCFVLDDEMELPTEEDSSQVENTGIPEFWTTQVTFEE